VFDIYFLDAEPEEQEEGWLALRGCSVLGEFQEEFLAALGPWTREQYQRHWIQAARRLVEGPYDRTGFFTSAFQFWWTMWREGEDVFVQQQLLISETLREPFNPDDPYRQLRDRHSTSDDGLPLSEWRLTMNDIRDFLARRSGAYDAP